MPNTRLPTLSGAFLPCLGRPPHRWHRHRISTCCDRGSLQNFMHCLESVAVAAVTGPIAASARGHKTALCEEPVGGGGHHHAANHVDQGCAGQQVRPQHPTQQVALRGEGNGHTGFRSGRRAACLHGRARGILGSCSAHLSPLHEVEVAGGRGWHRLQGLAGREGRKAAGGSPLQRSEGWALQGRWVAGHASHRASWKSNFVQIPPAALEQAARARCDTPRWPAAAPCRPAAAPPTIQTLLGCELAGGAGVPAGAHRLLP